MPRGSQLTREGCRLCDLPREWFRVRSSEQKCAAFARSDPHTVNRIWNRGLPNSGMKAVVAPNFERHDETFDPATGNAGVHVFTFGGAGQMLT